MKIKTLFANLLAMSALAAASSHADVFTLGPGSTADFSGDMTIQIVLSGAAVPGGSATFTGNGAFTPVTPGSLHSDLAGTINASSDATVLSFTGGSAVRWTNPDAFAFNANIPLTGPVSGFSLQMTGKIHDAVFDVQGSAPLSGAPGNQTFDTNGLQLFSTGGVFDGTVTACVPACMPPRSFSFSMDGGPPDTLPAGVGSLVAQGGVRTFSFPILLDASSTQTQTEEVQQGVTATTTMTVNAALDGVVTASIPEPSSRLLMICGLVGVGVFVRQTASRKATEA